MELADNEVLLLNEDVHAADAVVVVVVVVVVDAGAVVVDTNVAVHH